MAVTARAVSAAVSAGRVATGGGERPSRDGGSVATTVARVRSRPRAGAARPPALPDDIVATDLDKDVRAELLSLNKPVAETVARHLVATGQLIDEDPAEALAHALAARRLASRIAAVREAVGLAAYHAGEWQTAIAELRTYHRMSGLQSHLAVLADCERALGRPERADRPVPWRRPGEAGPGGRGRTADRRRRRAGRPRAEGRRGGHAPGAAS